MGLATIEPHSHKVQTKLYNSPSLVEVDPNVSKIQPFENVKIYKEMRHGAKVGVQGGLGREKVREQDNGFFYFPSRHPLLPSLAPWCYMKTTGDKSDTGQCLCNLSWKLFCKALRKSSNNQSE